MYRGGCRVCGGTKDLVRFFIEMVCVECMEELRKISLKEYSERRDIVTYYIKTEARFLHKNPCEPDSDLFQTLTIDQLNKLAQYLMKMSRINLLY